MHHRLHRYRDLLALSSGVMLALKPGTINGLTLTGENGVTVRKNLTFLARQKQARKVSRHIVTEGSE